MDKEIDVNLAKIDTLIEKKYKNNIEFLVMILQDITRSYNYIPPQVLPHVARKLGVPLSKVFSLATFYKAFSLEPRGKYVVSVCTGTACHVRGAKNIMNCLYKDLKIKEGEKERIQVFQGTVISRRGSGTGQTFTVRKISSGVGVERVFPTHSPNIAKIERVSMGRVRRAKLYYLRGRTGKAARIKEKL